MNNVEKIASNADGKPVQSTTSDEDQPDVVRLPDRADRPVDQLARPAAALAAAGEQAPETGAEVGAAEDGVHRHADHEHDGDGVRALSSRAPAATAAGGPVSGPYGTSTSCSSAFAPASRHRAQRDDQRRAERDVEREHERRT